VVAMLGALKAGAAYVPLDPEHPAERLRALCDDAGVGAIVTESKWLDRLPAAGATVLAVDRDAMRIAALPDAPPEVHDADDIACVMSTSGSTGRPKAVPIPHSAIANLVVDNDYAPVAPGDVVAHLAHPAFDVVTFEVWGALANGATLVPIDKATALEPRVLAARLRARSRAAAMCCSAARASSRAGCATSCAPARPRGSCTSTGRPRRRRSRRSMSWTTATPRAPRSRSGARSPAPRSTCSTAMA